MSQLTLQLGINTRHYDLILPLRSSVDCLEPSDLDLGGTYIPNCPWLEYAFTDEPVNERAV
jgi:hypothetical protein